MGRPTRERGSPLGTLQRNAPRRHPDRTPKLSMPLYIRGTIGVCSGKPAIIRHSSKNTRASPIARRWPTSEPPRAHIPAPTAEPGGSRSVQGTRGGEARPALPGTVSSKAARCTSDGTFSLRTRPAFPDGRKLAESEAHGGYAPPRTSAVGDRGAVPSTGCPWPPSPRGRLGARARRGRRTSRKLPVTSGPLQAAPVPVSRGAGTRVLAPVRPCSGCIPCTVHCAPCCCQDVVTVAT